MGGKPKLTDLIGVAEQKAKPKATDIDQRRIRNHSNAKGDTTDVELLRIYCVHLIASGFDRKRAIELTFPSRRLTANQIRSAGTRFIKHPHFTEIISTEIEKIESKLASSEKYVLNKMYRQAEANIFDYFDVGADGKLVLKDLKSLPKHIQQNVKKLKIKNTINDMGLGRQVVNQEVELEIVDSFKPVAMLGKNIGMFIEKVEVDFGPKTADRLQEALERVRQKRLGDGHQQHEDQSRAP